MPRVSCLFGHGNGFLLSARLRENGHANGPDSLSKTKTTTRHTHTHSHTTVFLQREKQNALLSLSFYVVCVFIILLFSLEIQLIQVCFSLCKLIHRRDDEWGAMRVMQKCRENHIHTQKKNTQTAHANATGKMKKCIEKWEDALKNRAASF